MTDLVVIALTVAILGVVLGWLIGHYHAAAQFKAMLAQIGPGLHTDLTKAEQDLVALFRKATGKAPAAAPAGSASPPAGASPPGPTV